MRYLPQVLPCTALPVNDFPVEVDDAERKVRTSCPCL
jgi:hypothetical protein